MFLWKGVLKICCKFIGEHPRWSLISIKLLCNFTTVLRAINKADYKYLRSRKKGILSKRDIAKIFRYYKDTLKNKIGLEFWSYSVSLYLNDTRFIHKTDQMDQAFAPQAREWRRSNEEKINTSKIYDGHILWPTDCDVWTIQINN